MWANYEYLYNSFVGQYHCNNHENISVPQKEPLHFIYLFVYLFYFILFIYFLQIIWNVSKWLTIFIAFFKIFLKSSTSYAVREKVIQ